MAQFQTHRIVVNSLQITATVLKPSYTVLAYMLVERFGGVPELCFLFTNRATRFTEVANLDLGTFKGAKLSWVENTICLCGLQPMKLQLIWGSYWWN